MSVCDKCRKKEGKAYVLIFETAPAGLLEPPQWAGILCDDCRDEVQEKLDRLLPPYR